MLPHNKIPICVLLNIVVKKIIFELEYYITRSKIILNNRKSYKKRDNVVKTHLYGKYFLRRNKEMDDDKKSKSMLLKLMWLDFIFGVIGIIIARNITPSNVSDLILSRTGGNVYTVDVNYYTYFLIKPPLLIYSIHRIYTGLKKLIIYSPNFAKKSDK